MAAFNGSNHCLDLEHHFSRGTVVADQESPSEVYEPVTIAPSVVIPRRSPLEDLALQFVQNQDEDEEIDFGNTDEGIEEDSDKSDKSIDGDDDSDWIEEIQSVSDVAFEEESSSDKHDANSIEEARDNASNKSDDIHAWHDQLTNNETASLTDDSYNHNSLHSQDTLQSQESLKSQESFNFQSAPLDDVALSLNAGDMDLSQEMTELFQKSHFKPKYSRGSPPPKVPDDSMTSDTSDLDLLEKGRRKKRRKGNDSDTTSDSDASLEANHEDSDSSSSSSSSSEGTQIWVPITRSDSFKKTLDTQSAGRRTPQRSNTLQSVRSTSSNPLPSTPTVKNHCSKKPEGKRIVAKHNHTTGRVETYLDECNGDSGIHSHSTDSPLLGRCSRPPSFQSLENAGRQTTPPPNSILKNAKEKSPRGASFSDCLFNSLSSVYCTVLVVLGTVLPVAEIFAEPIPQNLFEAFYVYIYGVSILFLGYVYVYLLQNKTAKSYRRHRRKRLDQRNGYCEYQQDRAYNRHERSRSRSYERNPCHKVGIATGSSHTGSFYLRLGAVVYGIGSMIHDGLKFSEIFDVQRLLHCGMILNAVRPLLHLAFTFIQLYFIFLNSKMCIHKFQVLARFGLMHMLATNVCIWISVTVGEIVREIITNPDRHTLDVSNLSSYYYTAPVNSSLNCSVKQDLMGRTVELASPYLYPLTAQYSVICTGIIFVMWQNIGNPLTKDTSYSEPEKKKTQWVVDCRGSNKGLFFGILLLVGAIVCMIVFYVLIRKEEYTEVALIVIYTSDIALYCGGVLATVLAFVMMRNMRFHGNLDLSLDQTLQMVGTAAVVLYNVFGLVAGIYNRQTSSGTLMIVCACAVLLQASLQTVFIRTGLRRFCNKNDGQQATKPGREFVAFLLVCNIALWGMATFERLRLDTNPIQYDFYGFAVWTLVDHICIPLVILYRFHSTVCLANVWKTAYKIKLQ